MSFLSEWALTIHRAIWFPLFWAVGLERPAVDLYTFDDVEAAVASLRLAPRRPAPGGSTQA